MTEFDGQFSQSARSSPQKPRLGHLRAAFHPSKPWVARTRELGRSRRVRKIGVIVLAVVLFLGLATYIAVPPILRHVLTGPVASSIHRQVSVGKIRFNLYRAEARPRPTACWRARRSAEAVRRSRASDGEGFVDIAVQICAGDRRSRGRETADTCGAGVAAAIQLFRFARERAGAGEAETGRAERADEIRGFEYSTARRRNNDRRSTARQAAQDREDSDQRAVYREPAVRRGRVRRNRCCRW